MLDVEAILRPHYDRLCEHVGGIELFDAHTHIGANDPDGFRQTPDELIAALDGASARGVVFPMHEPEGYRTANDVAIQAAADSGGKLVAYCRVDPHDRAVEEATRALDAGAQGIKLHPRAEQFGLDVPAVRDIVALAHERRVPILIHAGRGIPALGQNTVAFSGEFPGAKLILAHAAISDLAWLWRVMPDHPNVFVDTAWWNPSDLVALFTLAPPGQILWASDSPYGLPVMSSIIALRCALQAGLSPEAVRSVAGGQMARILEGQGPADVGPPPRTARVLDPLLERVVTHLVAAMSRAFARTDPSESLALARLACAVGEDAEYAPVYSAVLEMLDRFEEHKHIAPTDGRPIPPAGRFVVTALAIARTPDVPLPADAPAPAPTRAEAERAA
jgi:predicted TIM-barrel fold metal-dependent hydrolase